MYDCHLCFKSVLCYDHLLLFLINLQRVLLNLKFNVNLDISNNHLCFSLLLCMFGMFKNTTHCYHKELLQNFYDSLKYIITIENHD